MFKFHKFMPMAWVAMLFIPSVPALAGQAKGSELESSILFDPFSYILLELGIIVIFAMLAHAVAKYYKAPVILAELIIGIVLGNLLYWLGWSDIFFLIMHLGDAGRLFWEVWNSDLPVSEAAKNVFSTLELASNQVGGRLVSILTGPKAPEFLLMGIALWQFSNLSSVFLLFKAGAETDLEGTLKVGLKAAIIAILSTLFTLLSVLVIGNIVIPKSSMTGNLLLGIALAPTSVVIATSLIQQQGAPQNRIGTLLISAALWDHLLGILLVTVIVTSSLNGHADPLQVGRIILLATVFLSCAIYVSRKSDQWRLFERAAILPQEARSFLPIALASFLSWLAAMFDLSVILGAFTAGMIFGSRTDKQSTQGDGEDYMGPLESIFSPIFFVFMGMQVNISHLLSLAVIGLGLILAVIALTGKIVAFYAVERDADWLSAGMSLAPRGEMALIVGSVGKWAGLINDMVFSSLVFAVICTMLIAPFAFKKPMRPSE